MSPSPTCDSLSLGAARELCGVYGVSRLEPLHAAEPRNVKKNSAPDEARAVDSDVLLGGSRRAENRAGVAAVVCLSVVGEMAERVNMGVAVAMGGHA